MAAVQESKPVLIKRYAGCRLYDTVRGRYLTVEDLRRWIADGMAFVVIDAETNADVTRVLLA